MQSKPCRINRLQEELLKLRPTDDCLDFYKEVAHFRKAYFKAIAATYNFNFVWELEGHIR